LLNILIKKNTKKIPLPSANHYKLPDLWSEDLLPESNARNAFISKTRRLDWMFDEVNPTSLWDKELILKQFPDASSSSKVSNYYPSSSSPSSLQRQQQSSTANTYTTTNTRPVLKAVLDAQFPPMPINESNSSILMKKNKNIIEENSVNKPFTPEKQYFLFDLENNINNNNNMNIHNNDAYSSQQNSPSQRNNNNNSATGFTFSRQRQSYDSIFGDNALADVSKKRYYRRVRLPDGTAGILVVSFFLFLNL
jgi:hypothetical protein